MIDKSYANTEFWRVNDRHGWKCWECGQAEGTIRQTDDIEILCAPCLAYIKAHPYPLNLK